MRKKVVSRAMALIMGAALALQPMNLVLAEEPEDPHPERAVLYENTFESADSLADFQDITGDLAVYVSGQKSELATDEERGQVWKLENGGGDGLGGMAFAKRLPREDTNVSYTFDMKLPEGAEGQIRIHSQELGNCGYNIYFREGEVALTKRSSDRGSDIPVKTKQLAQPREEEWYTYKITFVDKTIAIQINGEDIVSAKDTDTTVEYPDGGITFSGWRHAAYIDNLKIEEAFAEDIPEPESVPFRMNRESVRLSEGDSTSISPVYDEISDKKSGFTYTSDNENVVTVDEYGILTAGQAGEATVTVTAPDGAEAQTKVSVNQPCGTFLYVASDGDDENGDGTEEKPFRTIEKARDTIREMDVLPDGGVTVRLRGGEYYIDETIVFTPEDSGEEGKPIVYASYPGETAEIHSGRKITGFSRLTDNYPAGLPEEAKGNVYVADVEKGWRFHDLYVNGERQQVARLFNTNDWSTWETFPEMPDSPLYSRDPEGMLVEFQPGHLDNLPSNGDVELYLLPVQWWNSLPVVTDVDAENNTARLQSFNPSIEPNGVGGVLFQNYGKYNLMNAPKFIDEPGEWCIDSENGKVYWWPENGKDLENAVAPNLTELIRLQGDEEEQNWEKQVEYLEFRNLTFKYADRLPENEWSDNKMDPDLVVRNAENPFAAIFMQGVENCALIDSKVLYTGAYAVALDHYAKNNRIVRNELGNLGCGGVQLYGYGPGSGKTRDINTGNVILANNIHDLGLAPYQHSSAITIYGASYTDGKFNLIERVPYTSIMITGTDADSMNPNYTSAGGVTGFNGRAYVDTYGNLTQYGIREQELLDLGREVTDTFNCSADNGRAAIPYQSSDCNIMEYNISRDYMLDMNDGGCYYAWSMGKNNEYNYNIAEKKENAKHMCWPLYMDDYASYVRLEGNRVWAMQISTLDKSQGTNVWTDNLYSDDMSAPPDGYEELQQTIFGVVEQMGGYLTTDGGGEYQSAPEIQGITVKADEADTYHTLITMPELPEGAAAFVYTVVDEFAAPPNIGDMPNAAKTLTANAENRIIAENGRKFAVYAVDENGFVTAWANITAVTSLEEQEIMLEDFEQENDGTWGPRYDWQILHGPEMNVIEDGENGHVWRNEDSDMKVNLNAGDPLWKDYAVEMEFRLNTWKDDSPLPEYDNVTLAGHALDERNSWMFIARKSGKLELNKFYANAGSKIVETDFAIEPGKWYQMKLVFRGSSIEGYIAEKGQEYGEPKLTCTDTADTRIPYGGIEVTSLGADFVCDNIRVTGVISDMRKNLEECLAKAKEIDLSRYTETSAQRVRAAIENAEEVLGGDSSQEQVEEAIEALEKAVAGLEEVTEPADKTLLQKTVDYAKTLSTDGVVESAKAYFEKVLSEAEALLADESADQEEVNAAWDNLLEGIWGLGIVQGDKTSLELLISRGEAMTAEADRYVETNWQQLTDALAAAKTVYGDGDALEEDVQTAADALLKAILAQRYKANKDNLQSLVDSLQNLDLSRYTEVSVQVFKAALAQANAVLADNTLSVDDQKTVDLAEKELAAARDALVAKADGSGDTGDGDNSGSAGDETNTGNGGNTGSSGSSGNGGNTSGGNSAGEKTESGRAPKTGDTAPTAAAAVMALAALAIGGSCIIRRKRYGK